MVRTKVKKKIGQYMRKGRLVKTHVRHVTKTRRVYPQVMSMDYSDRLPFVIWKGFYDVNKAKAYAEKKKGILYTQVDGDRGTYYDKGEHWVNRTGFYIVVRY